MDHHSCNLLFVYGTLMKGMGNAFADQLSSTSEFLGSATAIGRLYDYQNEYPCAVENSVTRNMIQGELYRLTAPESLLPSLDAYEDCYPDNPKRSLFIRKITPVRTHLGTQSTAWMYFWNRPTDALTLIPTGDYRSYRFTVADKRLIPHSFPTTMRGRNT